MSSSPAIEISHLDKSFGKQQVLYDMTLSVEAGSIFGFLGPNGSGKSTTIKILCGLLDPSAGGAKVLGMDIQSQMTDIRRQIGYMSQQFGLYDDLTVMQNLRFYSGLYGVSGQHFKQRLDEIVRLTKIGPYLKQKAGYLSGGWKQRLALGCAIIHEPPVIFLDEPTAGIDPVARRDLWDLLFDLSSEGVTLFVTTHYMDEAERCHKVAYIFEGHLIAYGTSRELRAMPVVTPGGARRLEISCEPLMKAYRFLHQLPDVLDVTVFGSHLHIIASNRADNRVIAQKLQEQQIFVEHITEIEPSLEDVFVSLTQKAISDRGKVS